MNIEELFLKRQSTREYDGTPVCDELLEKICRLATLAPSACNGQPYNLYAVTGEKAKKFGKYIQIQGRNQWAENCPAYIVIEERAPVQIKRGENVISNAPFIGNDVGILSAYLALAAEDNGVQSCIVGLRDEKAIAEFLNLPEGTKFPLIVALGIAVKDYKLREKKRRPFEQTYTLIK